MKNKTSLFILLLFLTFGSLGSISLISRTPDSGKKLIFPYKKAGLTERQAAAHLLSRFTYGATPGQIEEVLNLGLEKWFIQQLKADIPETLVTEKLAGYQSLVMTNEQIAQTFPKGNQVLKMAIKDGIIEREAVNKDDNNKRQYRKKLTDYMVQKGLRQQGDLFRELINQKIIRATYSPNQLQEVLTSFWFNHFNVSLTKNDCSPFITSYERDVIRPNVIGKFETLLRATAKSPAMLTYLDNVKSQAPNLKAIAAQNNRQQKLRPHLKKQQAGDTVMAVNSTGKILKTRNANGLNENYAREIMELHTLGVDGGYTQSDVTQAARVLTGWTIMPMGFGAYGKIAMNQNNPSVLKQRGFLRDGNFVFAGNRHDKGEKVVLGVKFPAEGGYEEGEKLIKMLAHHPATARFISIKLATRFVSDKPAKILIDHMAKSFAQSKGDIKQVLLTMVTDPEFWSKEILREKTKSPFELAISSVRGLGAEIESPFPLYSWISKMGEKMYYYQAPTGFPDRGSYWINTGSLLNRMNFGLALASGRIAGIILDLAALNKNREPESAEAALVTYCQYLMPERNLKDTLKRLTPTINDPLFSKKVNVAAEKTAPALPADMMSESTNDQIASEENRQKLKGTQPKKNGGKKNYTALDMQTPTGNNTMLAQVVGIIIGSPEFQRR